MDMCMRAHVHPQPSSTEPSSISNCPGRPESSDDRDASGPGELGRSFDRLHCLASAQIFARMAEAMRSIDLSFSQINALFRLYRYGPQRIAALAESAHLTPGAASRLADRLVRDGLAEKQWNPDNRRERQVRLTDLGLACLERLRRSTAEAYDEVLAPLPARVRTRLLAVLRDMDPLLPREPID